MTSEKDRDFFELLNEGRSLFVRERELIEKTKKFYADLRSRGIDTSIVKTIAKHRDRMAAQ